MRARFTSLVPALLVASLLAAAAPVRAQNDLAEVQVQIAEARRHFEALEYEQAVPALDRAIAILSVRRTEDTRRTLADAYEMRARSRFGLGDQNGAREDLLALLRVNPGHRLTGQISPRVVTMFEDAQKATITEVKLSVSPENATVMLDGAPVPANATMPILIGDHTLTATRVGYRPGTATFSAAAGPGTEASLVLARSSAVLAVVTSPADVDVIVDGVVRGKTAGGPPGADYAERASRAGVPLASLSAVLTLADIAVGSHRIEFRRGCYVSASRPMNVTQLDDVVMDPVKLERAVATIVAQSNQAGTTVFVDGQERGGAPYTAEVCEGEHLVELRSPNGRFARRVDAKAGQKMEVTGALKPAFAVVSSSGQGPLNADVKALVERAFEPVQSILLFVPPADRVDAALKGSQLPPEWLAFDANKRALGISADISAPMRRDLTAKIAKAFDAQGVASVTIPSTLNRNRVVVSFLGAGASEPDIVEFSLDRPDTISSAVALLNQPIPLTRPAIGITTLDVADVTGAIVATVDPDGPSRAALQPGDLILKAGTQTVNDTAAFNAALTPHAANDTLGIDLKDKTGAAKHVEVKVVMTPRLIGMNDQTLLANRVLAELRSKLLTPLDPLEESIVRLNLAAALARLQSWSEARSELQKVKLPEGRAVGNGTVQYLLGLAADNLGNRAEAETAWRVAASSDSLMTEDGPPVRELAEARIAELSRRR
jgi:tetratricopeptide (TPR) repeat protein